jgi:UDP-glucose 4-epimerase
MTAQFKYKKALVTGGAGFIGSHLVEELVNLGVETISVDNYFAGKHENLAHLKSKPNFHEVECDVTDRDTLDQLLPGVEIIFHEAASKKTICMRDPLKDLQINGGGTLNLLQLSIKHGIKKFVHASTGSVYGEPKFKPQNETHPLNPTSYYGVSKLAGERYVKVFEHMHGLNTTVLRYFHVYGPRQESSDVGGVVSIFARRMLHGDPIIIYGTGHQERSFTYVKDVVKANILAAEKKEAEGKVFNCASGIKVTIKQLADMVAEQLGISDQEIIYEDWTPGDIKVFDVDNSLIRETLGLDFLTDFKQGLAQTIAWSKEYFSKDLEN